MRTLEKRTKCRDLYFRVRYFTWLTFLMLVIYLLDTCLLIFYEGLELYSALLLVLTLGCLYVSIANLVRLRAIRRDALAVNMPGRGYLVPLPWTNATENEHEATTTG